MLFRSNIAVVVRGRTSAEFELLACLAAGALIACDDSSKKAENNSSSSSGTQVASTSAAPAAAPAQKKETDKIDEAIFALKFFSANERDKAAVEAKRILAEIDKQFTAALAQERVLKATPVEQFDDLLEKGTVPDAYRPTLFDFVAHDALAFYQAGEQGAAAAEDEFELSATDPVFAPVPEFLAWKPRATDSDSPTLRAVALYQNLLAFHQGDSNRTAFIDADLYRLHFGKNQAVGEDVDARYKAALKRFVDEWADSEISTRAPFIWASVLVEEEDLVEAHKLAKRGADVFPKSYGSALCFNLLQQIESKQVNITTERVWNEPWPVIAEIGRAHV